MPAPDAAVAFDVRQRALASAAVGAVERQWGRLTASGDWDVQFSGVVGRMVAAVTAAQLAAATDAARYVPAVLAETGQVDDPVGVLEPAAFAGAASDGRELAGLLRGGVVAARSGGGLASGRDWLRMAVLTQVADAGREAVGVGIAVRPHVTGYVRMLTPPSCARCAILAGKWFRWNAGFQRHHACDCKHVPATEDIAGDLRTDVDRVFASGRVTGLSRAQAAAIRDGADPGQVVNAARGMSTTEIGVRRFQTTTEGTTRRGYASAVRRAIDSERGVRTAETSTSAGRRGFVENYRVRRVGPRLTPAEIYRVAGSRADAIRLLEVNGYVVPSGGRTIRDLARTVA